MTTLQQERLARGKRLALGVALLAALGSAALAWMRPQDFGFAWRFAALACLVPSAGSLIFLLIYRSTGGQWGTSLEPFLVSGARLLPWVWLLFFPAIWLAPSPTPQVEAAHTILRAYVTPTGGVIRAIIYLAVFFGYWWLCAPSGKVSDPADVRGNRYRWFGPAGLIVLAFMLHLLAVDWLMSLEPGWVSTAYPLTWMAGLAVGALGLAVLTAIALGLDPARVGPSHRAFGLDWGNLLLASVVFWTYVGFMQFLIIWSGDIPNELVWYVHRNRIAWRMVLIAVVAIHVAIPFFALLSRKLKKSAGGLAAVAGLLVLAQFLYQLWMIVPAGPRGGFALGLDLTLLALGASLFANRYLALVEQRWPITS